VSERRRPRIEPVHAPTGELEQILAVGWQHNGKPLNAAATLAHHPRLLKRFTVFTGLFLSHSGLPDRDRELITLRTSHRCGLDYYIAHHVQPALAAGLTHEEIRGTCDEAFEWGGHDRVVIAAADELVAGATLSDATWDQLAAVYGPDQLAVVLLLPGFYRMLAGFVNTIGVELEPGMAGWLSVAVPDTDARTTAR
jgi:4-carboxymuconolactone decarboxylase